MDLKLLFTTAFIVALSGAMIPGPMLSAAIAETLRRDWRVGPYMVLGHGLLEIALILALVAGLAGFLVRPEVSLVIAIVGGIVLVLLGGLMSRDLLGSRLSLEVDPTSQPNQIRLHPVVAGATVSLANPYWWLWWATIGLTYISLAMKSGSMGMAAFFSGHISADLAWYSMVSIVLSGGRKFFNPTVYKVILGFCALFLIGTGGYFIYHGLTG